MKPMSKYANAKGEEVVMEGTENVVKINNVEFKRVTKASAALAAVAATPTPTVKVTTAPTPVMPVKK